MRGWTVVVSGTIALAMVGRGARGDGARPDRARAVPEPPAWATTAEAAVAVAGRGAVIAAKFHPTAGVTHYRVTVATVGGDPVVTFDATSDPQGATVTIHRLRPGRYVAQIATVDANGVEGQRSAELPIEIIDLPVIAAGRDELVATATDAVTAEPTVPVAPVELELGARLMVPAALTCHLDDDPAASWVVVTRAGATALHCARSDEVLATPAIVGTELGLALAGPPPTLPRTGTTTLELTMRDPAAAPAVDAVATGLRVRAVEAIATGVRVTVETAAAGGRLAELDLVLRDAPEITLAQVALAIAPPVEVVRDRPSDPELDDGRFGLEAGAYLGAIQFPTSDRGGSELGNANDPDYRVASGPAFGARLAVWPTTRVGLEAEVGLIPTHFAIATERATVVSLRGQLAIRFVQDGRFGLRGAVGAGALMLVSGAGDAHADTDSEVHWGLGFTVGVSRWQLRLDARHLIGPARDAGYASMFELDLGAGVRFGR